MRQQPGEAGEFFPVCRCRREPVVKSRIEHEIPWNCKMGIFLVPQQY